MTQKEIDDRFRAAEDRIKDLERRVENIPYLLQSILLRQATTAIDAKEAVSQYIRDDRP